VKRKERANAENRSCCSASAASIPDDEATEEVHAEGAERKIPRLGLMQEGAAQFVTCHRTKRPPSATMTTCLSKMLISFLVNRSHQDQRGSPGSWEGKLHCPPASLASPTILTSRPCSNERSNAS